MKIKAAIPESEFLEGEKNEPLVQVTTRPMQQQVVQQQPTIYTGKNTVLTTQESTAMVQQLIKRGLMKRAIVAALNPGENGGEIWNPKNWGIVVDVKPFQRLALVIAWADGGYVDHDGNGIQVIYPGMSAREIKDYVEGNRH